MKIDKNNYLGLIKILNEYKKIEDENYSIKQILNLLGISKETILQSGDILPKYRLKDADDCQRIKMILINKGFINAGLLDACYLWSNYSDSYAAGWLGLSEDDEELFDCIKPYIVKTFRYIEL